MGLISAGSGGLDMRGLWNGLMGMACFNCGPGMTVQASSWESYEGHSYLRLEPEIRAEVDGPHIEDEPLVEGERHPVLRLRQPATGYGRPLQDRRSGRDPSTQNPEHAHPSP